MSVRNDILIKIKPLAKVEHPGVFQGASTEFDFRASLEVVGARVVTQNELEDLFPGKRRFDKTLDGLSLEEVEVLEIDGEFGVAENGAIWLREEVLIPAREDECCGFGGTFCVTEEAVSVKMGQDRIKEHDANEVEYIVGADTSCLMHMEGILRRQGSKVQVKHIVEILNHA